MRHFPGKLSLGLGHVGIAGADDQVNAGNGLGAESQGRYRLGAASQQDLGGAASRAAAATSGGMVPSRRGGVATITSGTRASFATVTVMITVEDTRPGRRARNRPRVGRGG